MICYQDIVYCRNISFRCHILGLPLHLVIVFPGLQVVPRINAPKNSADKLTSFYEVGATHCFISSVHLYISMCNLIAKYAQAGALFFLADHYSNIYVPLWVYVTAV